MKEKTHKRFELKPKSQLHKDMEAQAWAPLSDWLKIKQTKDGKFE